MPDGLPAFRALRAKIERQLAIVTGSGRASVEHPEFRWVNMMLGNLKNAVSGTYHALEFAKYAARYLAYFQYCFNRCYDHRSILLRAAITTHRGPKSSSPLLSLLHSQADNF